VAVLAAILGITCIGLGVLSVVTLGFSFQTVDWFIPGAAGLVVAYAIKTKISGEG
jgi:hypothetical protein